jgi:Tfp pilus assembly protein PilN
MMLLNLTSPEAHKDISLEMIIGLVRSTITSLVGICLCFIIICVVGVWILQDKAATLKNEADLAALLAASSGQTTIADTTKQLNAQIRTIVNVQTRFIKWTPIIESLSTIIPSEITINSISLIQSTNKISLRGVASTRDAYAAFEKTLNNSDIVGDFVFPLQTKKVVLDFSVTGTLKLKK